MASEDMKTLAAPQIRQAARSPSAFVRTMRKVYRPLGFNRGYNAVLCFIFAGAMLGFTVGFVAYRKSVQVPKTNVRQLARLSYLNISGKESSSFASGASPGEWYSYRKDHYRVGITLHLSACLPAGLLMVWQFVPAIRHKFLLFHRINGYAVILLTFISNVGALMICRVAFGGGLDTQSGVGLLVVVTNTSICMAYYNIKRLQIDQHRAWMLRFVFYMGTIITLRIIMIISAVIITTFGGYYQVSNCEKVLFINDGDAMKVNSLYPQCANRTSSENPEIVVEADLFGGSGEGAGASLGLSFGMAMWLAIFLHGVGVEIYLNLTSAEGERLRNVSYERQLEAGYQHPGSAGLTSDRWGDVSAWRPAKPKESTSA